MVIMLWEYLSHLYNSTFILIQDEIIRLPEDCRASIESSEVYFTYAYL